MAVEDALEMAQLLDAEHESMWADYRGGAGPTGHKWLLSHKCSSSQWLRVEVQDREFRRLSALLVEHQAILRSSPERPHHESPQASPPRDLSHLRSEVEDILPSTINTVRGAAEWTGQVPDLGGPPIVRRDTFEDILADVEDEVPTTPQRWVWFPDVATSTPVLRCREHLEQGTHTSRASQVPSIRQGLFDNPQPQKDLFEKGFSHSFQVAATEFRKLWEPKVAKLKGGYSSDVILVYQSWLKDIQV